MMRNFVKDFGVGLLGVAAGAAVVGGVVWARDDGGSGGKAPAASGQPVATAAANTSGGSNTSTRTSAATTSEDFSALYDAVRPSIVEIRTGASTGDPFSDQATGLGSGVVLDKDGNILTNYHVVRGSDTVTVTFADETVARGEVVGTDPGNDMAVVRVKVDNPDVLKPATLGDSSQVKVGEVVAAIGNPFGLDGTFTTGVISGLNRTLPSSSDGRPIRGLLQTDAAVNPGNSGGALINTKGEIIGINTAIENPGGNSFAGVAYAVPINTPKRFMTQLVSGQTIRHARLGISGKNLSADDLRQLGIDHGVAVVSVDPGSAAAAAGLRSSANGQGDVITAIDGHEMRSFTDVADYIDSKSVGDKVKISVHRNGQDIELEATLKSWDSSA
jgi:S1-C subfamily serine protease